MAKKISAQEVVKKFDISYHTLNYYTTIGLLRIDCRKRNQRFYDEEEVRQRLQEISKLSSEGYPLSLIRRRLVGL